MIVVKKGWLSILSIPISEKAFGKNKTVRGFILLPVINGIIVVLFSYLIGPFVNSFLNDFYIGIGLGIIYLISELPNSFIKRRLGIRNGEHSKKYRLFQVFMDKSDSLIGMLIFYYFVTPVDLRTTFYLFFIALSISLITSFLLHTLKIKKSF